MKKNIPLICIGSLCILCALVLVWSSSMAPEGSHEYDYVPTPEPTQQIQTTVTATVESTAVPNTVTPSPKSTVSPTPEPTPEPVFPPGVHKGKYEQKTEIYGNQFLEYNVVVPENADKNMPMVVFLGGDELNDRLEQIPEKEFAKAVKDIYGDKFNFIMLLPCTRFYEWHAGWVGEILKGLIDDVAEKYSVDKDKIILTGYARGAEDGWYTVEDYGDYFSCFVPVSGGSNIHNMESFKKVPIWAFYGTDYSDKSYSKVLQYAVDKVNENGGNAKITALEGEDHDTTSTAAYTKEVIEWMLEQ